MKIIRNLQKKYFWLIAILTIILFFLGGGLYFNGDLQGPSDSTSSSPAEEATSSLAEPPAESNYLDVELGPYPSLGSSSAPVKIIQFADFQCPYCGTFHEVTFPKIKEQYIKEGKVEFYFHDFPFLDLHPSSKIAHQAARCATKQGSFWQLHNLIFQNQDELNLEEIRELAGQLNLNQEQFLACLDTQKSKEPLKDSYNYARRLGLRSTPTFLISSGKVRFDQANKDWIQEQLQKEEKIKLDYGEGWIVVGAQEFDIFKKIIETELSSK